MKNLRKNKKGFTLVEVIVVLVILAILIAIAVPSVMKYIDDANEAKYLAQARGAMIAMESEITKDYADDKAVDTGKASTDAITEIDLTGEITEIKAFTNADGTGDYISNDKAEVSPNKIKSYRVTFKNGTKVLIPVNGSAEVEKN
ncbi:MAG: prepilin-type N-terminal cleavage/methylation domain-containing protein [Erysipelotrichia bacterium]|nr:prepilin-type N-terminal cleavage/methylation domain-containing protein [Erysipelotrichia bacterium]NCC53922.1 prepilin-type N-terminal cleavage/methylation domain-containing protein [Erysipelotrichia bacterium]